MLSFHPFKNPLGLDISDFVMRVVQLKQKGKTPQLASVNEIIIPEGLIVDGEIQDQQKIADTLKRLIRKARGDKIKTPYCVFSLPERKTLIKIIQIPKINLKNLPEAIKWETTKHIPFALDEVYLDWQRIKSPGTDHEIIDVLVAIAPKTIVNSYLQTLEMASLIPIAIETESIATIRSILNNQSLSTLIVDIGGSRTNLILYDKNSIQFTLSIPFSGRLLTEKIAERLNISIQEAEKAKIICGLDPKKGKGQIKKLLEPIIIEELVKNIRGALDYYKNHFINTHEIKQILLSGGGAKLRGLSQVLTAKLNMKTECANPLLNISTTKNIIAENNYLSFTTAIGLSLRSLYYHDFN